MVSDGRRWTRRRKGITYLLAAGEAILQQLAPLEHVGAAVVGASQTAMEVVEMALQQAESRFHRALFRHGLGWGALWRDSSDFRPGGEGVPMDQRVP